MKLVEKIIRFRRIIILAILAGLLFSFSSRLLINKFVNTFLFKYQEINVRESFIGEADDPTGEKTFSSPLSEGRVIRQISPKTPRVIRLNFKNLISFDGFSLFFYGDLHSVSSILAKDFWVYYRDANGKQHMIDEVRNNTSPVYRFRSPTTISTDAIEIVVSKAAFYDTIRYGDLKFFNKQRVSLWEGVKFLIDSQRRSLVGYWFYYLLFFGLLFLPGYVLIDLIDRRKKFSFDSDTRLIFSPVFSIVFLFLITLACLLIGNKAIFSLYLLVFLGSLILFFRKKSRLFKKLRDSTNLLLFMTAALLIIFLVIAQRDYLFNLQYIYHYLDQLKPIPMRGYYGYEADNLFQWGIARAFLHRLSLWGPEAKQLLLGAEASAVFDRTPVLPMITTVILNIFGESHFVYQRFLEVLAVLYYGAMYLVIKTYFSKRTTRIVSLLILLNVPLSFMAFNAELFYKYFALYPVLLALAVFFKQKKPNSILMGGLMGLSFLIHPMTLIFSAVILLLYLLRYRLSFEFFKRAGIIFLILILLIGGWYFVFKMIKNISGAKTPSLYLTSLTNVSGQLATNKFLNLLNLFIPNIQLRTVTGEKISFGSFEFWLPFLRYSLIFNITPVFFALLLIYPLKNIKKDYQILILGLVPLLLLLIFYVHQYDYHYGGYYFLLYPFTIPFLLAYVATQLIQEKKIIRFLAFGSYIIFMFISLYFISGVFIKMKCASLVVQGLFLMILGVYFSLSAWLLKFVFRTRRG